MNKNVISLYCGAGGIDEGLRQIGNAVPPPVVKAFFEQIIK